MCACRVCATFVAVCMSGRAHGTRGRGGENREVCVSEELEKRVEREELKASCASSNTRKQKLEIENRDKSVSTGRAWRVRRRRGAALHHGKSPREA